MNTKYKFTGETKQVNGVRLNRIEALKDFGYISKGERGGYIESEENLSMSGNAWVSGNARVSGKLKLKAGYFFGVKWQSDTEIKQVEISNGDYLIYKGEAKFG